MISTWNVDNRIFIELPESAMPLYEYVCSTCGQNFEKALPVDTDKPNVRCPAGHRKVHRIYSTPVVMFKGTGFYSTDHRSDRSVSDGKS
ncbi:MAG TPA: zinc ribbon domain-containing protein [Anaerolineales bacterium]|jgi:putative FmdB family regulatory protein